MQPRFVVAPHNGPDVPTRIQPTRDLSASARTVRPRFGKSSRIGTRKANVVFIYYVSAIMGHLDMTIRDARFKLFNIPPRIPEEKRLEHFWYCFLTNRVIFKYLMIRLFRCECRLNDNSGCESIYQPHFWKIIKPRFSWQPELIGCLF
jgi:hypothetical protein